MSGMTGTGLKKCMPMKRAAASLVDRLSQAAMAMELVFEAKIASGAAAPSSSRHSAALDLEVLEDGLDDEVGRGDGGDGVGRA